jgi:hypothetical protein
MMSTEVLQRRLELMGYSQVRVEMMADGRARVNARKDGQSVQLYADRAVWSVGETGKPLPRRPTDPGVPGAALIVPVLVPPAPKPADAPVPVAPAPAPTTKAPAPAPVPAPTVPPGGKPG